ncbi:hypothetical protein ANCCAN_02777, partial [Ancylostoma caninum]
LPPHVSSCSSSISIHIFLCTFLCIYFLFDANSTETMGMMYYSMAALNGNLADQLQSQLSYTNLQNGVDIKPFAPSPSYKRMAQRRKVPEGELCAVCSDLATGYHYGVASCNGW